MTKAEATEKLVAAAEGLVRELGPTIYFDERGNPCDLDSEPEMVGLKEAISEYRIAEALEAKAAP
jgi:hypothetical protein